MERIGKYEISRLLGEGATSSVYLGFDPFTQREVAIKRLHPETCGSDHTMLYRHLLLNEASLAGKLQHPHIIQIHDAVIDDKDAYVVMEYVPGGTLEAFTKPDNLLPSSA
jgi:serine/threonine protein kinase